MSNQPDDDGFDKLLADLQKEREDMIRDRHAQIQLLLMVVIIVCALVVVGIIEAFR
jgi:hypothetical protein